MIVCQELLLPLKPRVYILVALEHDGFVEALGESLEKGPQLLPSILGTHAQLKWMIQKVISNVCLDISVIIMDQL